MKWFRWLSRSSNGSASAVEAVPSAPPPAGIDYLLAKAGVAQPVSVAPVVVALDPEPPPERLQEVTVQWQVLQERAEQAQNRADWVEVEAIWRLMRTQYPQIWFSYAGGAVALYNLGRHDEAAHLLADGYSRFPHERAFPLEQGRQAASLGNWPAAETHWRAALTFEVRPWWVYTELAGALEHQGRLTEAEAVLLEGQERAEEPNEITLYTYPARLAWKREDWALALARWVEARRRFPLAVELPDRQHEALMRLAEHDPQAYKVAVRELGLASPDEEKGAMVLRFESLGGTGPDGGCEFGCFQRRHGAEPLGLFRWAAVPPESLIACLNARFAGLGEIENITIAPHDGQWEITDTIYHTKMHSFVSIDEVPHDRMLVLASKRMRYLKDKLIADLENPAKIFVLKVAWGPLTARETEALSQAMRSYGPGELLCVCQSDPERPAGTIINAAPAVFIGYIDFSSPPFDMAQRPPAWDVLCQRMLGMSSLSYEIADRAISSAPAG